MSTLFLFVEGPDDERFMKHHFANRNIKPVNYAGMTSKAVNNMIRTIKNTRAPYLFITDSDGAPAATKRQKVIDRYSECEDSKIIVVCFEIESWYLAGLNQPDSQKLGVKFISLTDTVTKEQFNAMIPRKMSRLDFMLEILQRFDEDDAPQRNTSYRDFLSNSHV